MSGQGLPLGLRRNVVVSLEGLCVEAIFSSLIQLQFRAHQPGHGRLLRLPVDIVTIPHLANLARRKYEALCLVIRRKHSPAGVSIS